MLVRFVIFEEARFRVPEPVTNVPIFATARLAAVVTERLVTFAVARFEVPVLVRFVILEDARFRVPEPVTSVPILATAKLAIAVTRLDTFALDKLDVPELLIFPMVASVTTKLVADKDVNDVMD